MDLITVLKTAETFKDIDRYWEEIAEIIPDITVMFGYDQNSQYHGYDLWEHSVRTVLFLPKGLPDDMIYLAALLHDIGKPQTRCRGKKPDDPYAHYYGHPEKSAEIIRNSVIPFMKIHGIELSEDEQRRLLYYVGHHDDQLGMKVHSLRKHLNVASLEEYKLMLQLADAKAHIMLQKITERIEACNELLNGRADELYEQILAEEENKSDE